MSKAKTVLVIGATGVLGSTIADVLSSQQWEVLRGGRKQTPTKSLRKRFTSKRVPAFQAGKYRADLNLPPTNLDACPSTSTDRLSGMRKRASSSTTWDGILGALDDEVLSRTQEAVLNLRIDLECPAT
jgi:nucleoside-diphosphate-sugar epimerase